MGQAISDFELKNPKHQQYLDIRS